jgi:hypothetical protein
LEKKSGTEYLREADDTEKNVFISVTEQTESKASVKTDEFKSDEATQIQEVRNRLDNIVQLEDKDRFFVKNSNEDIKTNQKNVEKFSVIESFMECNKKVSLFALKNGAIPIPSEQLERSLIIDDSLRARGMYHKDSEGNVDSIKINPKVLKSDKVGRLVMEHELIHAYQSLGCPPWLREPTAALYTTRIQEGFSKYLSAIGHFRYIGFDYLSIMILEKTIGEKALLDLCFKGEGDLAEESIASIKGKKIGKDLAKNFEINEKVRRYIKNNQGSNRLKGLIYYHLLSSPKSLELVVKLFIEKRHHQKKESSLN